MDAAAAASLDGFEIIGKEPGVDDLVVVDVPVMAPTMRWTSIIRFRPSRWICPGPQYGTPSVLLVVRLRTAMRATAGARL